jgi:hypothetical protein
MNDSWTARLWGVGFRVVLLSLVLAGPVFAQDGSLAIHPTPERIKQGGVATLRIRGAAPADRLRLRVGSRNMALGSPSAGLPRILWIGVDLEQPPGPLEVVLDGMTIAGQTASARTQIIVVDGNYPVQRLSVPRSFTELDAPTLARVASEKGILDRLWETVTPARMWHTPFRVPLQDAGRGSGFGLKRVINGDPRAPHTGVDFSVPAGTPVLAANAGVVVLAEEHFFAGKSLVLDHGEGLYTMYFHLQESLVGLGRRVAQGEPIGRVGHTGRATGPHLHWGARLGGARIDPEALLQLNPE